MLDQRQGDEPLTSSTPIAVATQRPSAKSGLLLGALLLLAFALRFYRLGDWTLEGDEIYTLRDSLRPSFANPRPLLFLLNHYLVARIIPLNEFGLRLIPALAGTLSVAAIYLIGRRLVEDRAALFAGLLMAISPVLVYNSQYARYWPLVLLLSTVYPYALYLGVRERSWPMVALGVVTGILAVLAHPVAVFPVGSLALLVLLTLRRDTLASLWRQPAFRWFTLVAGVLVLIAAVRSIDMLHGWIVAHDTKTRIPDHLRDAPRPLGVRQAAILLAYVEGLTLPVVFTGLGGICLLWQTRDRLTATLLGCVFAVPVATVLLLSVRTPISVNYMISATPAILLGAGLFLDRLAHVDLGARPRWLVATVVTAAVIAAGLPTLVSQYRDGRRYDFRGAARWLESRVEPGDVVFSPQSRVLSNYLKATKAIPLAPDTIALARSARTLRESAQERSVWIVVPAPSHAFRSNLHRGGLIGWIFDHCQLRNSIGVGRMDFRQQYLHIYRCPPVGASAASHPAPQDASGGTATGRAESPLRPSTSR
jgi:hypothetical protein